MPTLEDVLSTLKGTVLWAISQDEIEQEFSWRRVLFTVIVYSAAIVLIVLVGALLVRFDRRPLGFALWFFGIPFAAFAGTINVAWGGLRFWFERRRARTPDPAPESARRELAPELHLSDDTKIGFLATILGLLALLVAFQVAFLLASVV